MVRLVVDAPWYEAFASFLEIVSVPVGDAVSSAFVVVVDVVVVVPAPPPEYDHLS